MLTGEILVQREARLAPEAARLRQTLHVCRAFGCQTRGSAAIQEALQREMAARDLDTVGMKLVGCPGLCELGPLVLAEPEGVLFTRVAPGDAWEIVDSYLLKGKAVERLLYHDPATGVAIPHYRDIGFFSKQRPLVLRHCGQIDPEDIEDYLAVGGYRGLKKALTEMTPEQVIAEVKRSGLRGRGGAGFPTGLKWEFCRQNPGAVKYIICNADEGDPGAFMDRSILESNPHMVLEGMAIAAYAIGAHRGYIYVRAEYPLAIERLRLAIRQAGEREVLGTPFSFTVSLKEGAGAFVCGEETALIASIEGKRGMPRSRPPFPAQSGLWGKPTVINNVKTLSSVAVVLQQGAEKFAAIGSEKSRGTAIFALAGKIANSGLIEVPMGIPLREVVFSIGGGIPGGRAFKAVQTGGPSGGCVPAQLLDLPVDYDSLTQAGSIMGSGGLIVMDEDTCMVDIARYFLSFTQKESCGKCTPCRIGTRHMLEILERITEGRGELPDLERLKSLAEVVKATSLCGLGQTAPNPVLTTLRYFRHEYESHIVEKRCPALRCRALIAYSILPEKCEGCGICLRNCPVGAISGAKRVVHTIDQQACIKCGACLDVCPARFGAVSVLSGREQLEKARATVAIPVGIAAERGRSE